MQIVYLSARPEVLSETISHLHHFAPFIDSALVVAPGPMCTAFETAAKTWPIAATLLSDEDVLGKPTSEITAMDHAARNYCLRTAAVRDESVDDVFVMADDDGRPLVPIDASWFVDPDGRHRRRFFYSLSNWRHSVTDFDKSLLHSLVLLRQRGFANPLAYSSHQPQIIDKQLYLAVAAEIADQAASYPPDEWSPYFTIGAKMAPERFAEPEPFTTLGWPQFPGEWAYEVFPPKHEFENFHGELYEDGGLYSGIPTTCAPESVDETTLDKIFRWYQLERQVRDLSFPDDVEQPWTTDSVGRKIAFKGLHAARGAYRYLTIDERARISELEGRVRRLEQD